MSLTKYILTEISDAKKEALFKLYLKKIQMSVDELGEERLWRYVREDFADSILPLDPTPNNQYTDWLLRKGLDYYLKPITLSNGAVKYHYIPRMKEDADKISEAILTHFNAKQRGNFPKEYKDINNISSITELRNIIKPFLDIDASKADYETLITNKLKSGEDYEVIHQDPETIIYRPLTEKGACVLGAETEWCTSYGEHSLNPKHKGRDNAFESYTWNMNTMFVVYIKKTNKRFQLDVISEQLMDMDDAPASPNDLVEKMSNESAEALVKNLSDESVTGEARIWDYFDNTITFDKDYIENIFDGYLSPYISFTDYLHMTWQSGFLMKILEKHFMTFVNINGDFFDNVYDIVKNEMDKEEVYQLFKVSSSLMNKFVSEAKSYNIKINTQHLDSDNMMFAIKLRPFVALFLIYLYTKTIHTLIVKVKNVLSLDLKIDDVDAYLRNPSKLISILKSISSVDESSIKFYARDNYKPTLLFLLRTVGITNQDEKIYRRNNDAIKQEDSDDIVKVLVETYYTDIRAIYSVDK